ncbi:hypothetical protein BDA96_10G291400 [Sorghum bicolor]|uniref:Knottins-like domain-containing protein n=2 Tax=Sorghum bicolor TaxID=4558 RepID=A0A921U2D9_SORBI|nr:hypothetical protein BDA96_10G291400 [Sorghum bicolor]OQU76865.1 hypothetical protein SORBI_3010G225175 [Sorghum bicolor]
MEPHSRRNLSAAAAAAVVLLLVTVTAEMASVGAAATCKHLSGTFQGMCGSANQCIATCEAESRDNIGGECDGFPFRCYCLTNC